VVTIGATASTPSKVSLDQKTAEHKVAAQAGPVAPKDGSVQAPSSTEKPVPVAGIIDGRQGPVSALEFQVSNSWQGPVPGSSTDWYAVWAGVTGSAARTPGVPAVLVYVARPTADGFGFIDTQIGLYTVAQADGPLKVTAISYYVLDLQTPTGELFHFNVQTDQFS
jgi:hypothetical protein